MLELLTNTRKQCRRDADFAAKLDPRDCVVDSDQLFAHALSSCSFIQRVTSLFADVWSPPSQQSPRCESVQAAAARENLKAGNATVASVHDSLNAAQQPPASPAAAGGLLAKSALGTVGPGKASVIARSYCFTSQVHAMCIELLQLLCGAKAWCKPTADCDSRSSTVSRWLTAAGTERCVLV